VRRLVLVATLGLATTACTLGPNYRRPPLPVPAEFRGLGPENPVDAGSVGDLGWWALFKDEALQALLRRALEANYDVRVAAARILEARARVTIARSFQFPEVRASASAPYVHIQGSPDSLQFKDVFAPAAGLDLTYEADLWGRYRRGTEAARAELLSSEYGRRFVMTSLVSDVATLYFQLRSLDLQLAISRRTLTSRVDSLALVTQRQEGGVAAMIDVRQTEILVATAGGAIPDIERQIEQTENAISILLGENPRAIARGRAIGEELVLPALPAGPPAALLERRPDVRQAEQELAAATARIGVAKTDFFPRLFLSGSVGAGGVNANGSWFGPQGIFSVLPSITLPLFNAGRVAAGVESAEASTEAARLQYEQAVQNAFRDVSDALVEVRKRREFRKQQEDLVVAARDTTRLANIRYQGGFASYLEVLDSDGRLFEAELGLARSQRDEVLGIVRLYKGLGGGWQQE
jgi:multidrug efflux system outer membrane protein